MQVSVRIVAGIGLLALLVIGSSGSARGHENNVPASGETFLSDAKEPHEQDAPCHGAVHVHSCGTHAACEGCGHGWVDTYCAPCDMIPHYPYFPAKHGYYYFRPYNHRHVKIHQEAAARWGGDPRNPYSNEVFQKVYAEYIADTTRPIQ